MPLFTEIDTVLHRLLIVLAMATGATLQAENWLRFRGPNGTGIAAGSVIEKPSFEDNLIWIGFRVPPSLRTEAPQATGSYWVP